MTPQIDLATETALAGHEIALIALALAVALGFLFRGLIRRRRGAARACGGCAGCGGASCKATGLDLPGTTDRS
ncbi:FeoB-associated Cys-rich membrane protein [Rhodovulum strictum]|uniref:FeoB-associated Cys-rich membrane protein n=1 Tax=Rhodovulum strictum TaxID=58314 RepID=A0A844B7E5_9RHOB|nr:FeoB-associated Cys-rich membrane protein [Rhodovulum strictum]MRH22171.1 FeoB-associated Cys-rich membrane protein [Rhodovulum strictum]